VPTGAARCRPGPSRERSLLQRVNVHDELRQARSSPTPARRIGASVIARASRDNGVK
jgi:hypothetical protein